jgi:DNA-binding transcriptional ArsR family regulator
MDRKSGPTVSQDLQETTVDEILDALGDRTRRLILRRLGDGPLPVVELARGLPVSRPAVSQHLKVLKGAGLVTDRTMGSRRLYAVNPEGLAELRRYLERFWADALLRFAAFAERSAQPEAKATSPPGSLGVDRLAR